MVYVNYIKFTAIPQSFRFILKNVIQKPNKFGSISKIAYGYAQFPISNEINDETIWNDWKLVGFTCPKQLSELISLIDSTESINKCFLITHIGKFVKSNKYGNYAIHKFDSLKEVENIDVEQIRKRFESEESTKQSDLADLFDGVSANL